MACRELHERSCQLDDHASTLLSCSVEAVSPERVLASVRAAAPPWAADIANVRLRFAWHTAAARASAQWSGFGSWSRARTLRTM